MNKIIICGRLGAAPTTRQAGASTVTSLRVATREGYGEKERTQWHTVEAWGALGENCARHLVSGQQVLVEGQLRSDEWEKNGVKQTLWKIVARTVEFLGRPQGKS